MFQLYNIFVFQSIVISFLQNPNLIIGGFFHILSVMIILQQTECTEFV